MVGEARTRTGAVVLGSSLLTMMIAGLAVPAAADHPELIDYERLLDIVADWEERGAGVTVAATTDEGRDVHLVALGSGPFTILYLNGLHANEPGSTEGFVRFVSALLGDMAPSFAGPAFAGFGPDLPVMTALADPALRAELLSKVTVVGFPMMDPDGVENGHVRDGMSNSDFQTNLTHFTAAIHYALRHHTVDLMLDSHGAPIAQSGLDMTVGVIEPRYAPPAVIDEANANAATAWAAMEAAGARVGYFEEHPLRIVGGCDFDPCSSVDEAYWAAVSRLTLLAQTSMMVRGIPAFYTESSSLDDGVDAVLRGAAANEVLMAALAFENAGMTDGSAPHTLDIPMAEAAATSVAWAQATPTGRVLLTLVMDGASALDRTLTLEQGEVVVAQSGPDLTDPFSLASEARALRFDAVAAGEYVVTSSSAVPDGDADALRLAWRAPDPAGSTLPGIVLDGSEPLFCWEWTSLWREAAGTIDPRLVTDTCA